MRSVLLGLALGLAGLAAFARPAPAQDYYRREYATVPVYPNGYSPYYSYGYYPQPGFSLGLYGRNASIQFDNYSYPSYGNSFSPGFYNYGSGFYPGGSRHHHHHHGHHHHGHH